MARWSDYVVLTDPDGAVMSVTRKGKLLAVVVGDRQLFYVVERDGSLSEVHV